MHQTLFTDGSKMKRSIRYILEISLKLVLVALITLTSYEVLNRVFYNNEVSHGDDFKSLPEDSIDVIVLGSSHAQYSFVPSFFYEETGLNSYVLGTSCQPYQVSYEMLKEALKTQQPQMVIMEVFTALPLRSSCEGDFCYIMAEYQMTGKEKINVIKMLPEEKKNQYLNDFFTYHNDWKTKESFEPLNKEENEISTGFGYIFQHARAKLPDNWWHASQYGYDIDIEIEEDDLESLNAIYDLCQKNNIELLLYKTPVDSFTREDQSMMHKMWEWADEHSVKYIDFFAESKKLSFYMGIHSDAFHAYINGASMITRRISDEVNTYEIESYDSEILKENYETEERTYTYYALQYETYPITYLKRLENTSGIVIVSYQASGSQLYKTLYNGILSLGVDSNSFINGSNYCAVIDAGKVVSEGKNTVEVSNADYDVSVTENGITINGEEHLRKTNLLIIYYNKDTNEIVEKQIDQYANMDYGREFYDWDNDLDF